MSIQSLVLGNPVDDDKGDGNIFHSHREWTVRDTGELKQKKLLKK